MAPRFNEEIHMNTVDIVWCAGILIALLLAALYVIKQVISESDDLDKQIDGIVKKCIELKKNEIK